MRGKRGNGDLNWRARRDMWFWTCWKRRCWKADGVLGEKTTLFYKSRRKREVRRSLVDVLNTSLWSAEQWCWAEWATEHQTRPKNVVRVCNKHGDSPQQHCSYCCLRNGMQNTKKVGVRLLDAELVESGHSFICDRKVDGLIIQMRAFPFLLSCGCVYVWDSSIFCEPLTPTSPEWNQPQRVSAALLTSGRASDGSPSCWTLWCDVAHMHGGAWLDPVLGNVWVGTWFIHFWSLTGHVDTKGVSLIWADWV